MKQFRHVLCSRSHQSSFFLQPVKSLGFAFDRQAAGSHEIWYNKRTGRYTTVPNHPGDMPEGTLRAIGYILKGKDVSKMVGKLVEATGIIAKSDKGDMIEVKSIEDARDTQPD